MSDEYRLAFSASADRSIARLPHRVAAAIVEFATGPLLDQPHRVGKPLGGELAGTRSARRGPYRVIYEIDEVERVVRVVRIDHRAYLYRSR